MKFKIITLGCKVNAYESELIIESFTNANFVEVANNSDADVIIINTCTVTNQADSKSRKMIRQARRENEDACLVVCGCAAENHKENLIDLDIDILIGNKDKTKLVTLVKDFLNNKKKFIKFYDLRNSSFEDMEITHFEGRTRGFVKIQDGCNNFCSYCIIPFTRGSIRSKDIDVAYKEIECLVNNGYQEIVLTGIHTGSYGNDTSFDITDLIKKISSLKKLKRIRISSIEITELDEKFLHEFKTNLKICSHLHIPIQSGSDQVLKDMNRKYSKLEFINKVKEIKTLRDDLNITTDLIVGYPTETDLLFNETIETVKECGFSKIHVFPYSKRDGTKSSTLKDIDPKVKKERTNIMLKLSDELESAYYKKYKGLELDVLVEDGLSGFTSNYIKVLLDKKCPHNTFVKVLITEVDGINVKGIVK